MKGTRHEELLEAIRGLAVRVTSETGVELVDVALRGSSANRALRVDIDRAGPTGVGLDDCQRVSAALGEALEDSELIESRYVLEVSSPGLDRPIRSEADFRRNTGRRVEVVTRGPWLGRTRFAGVLLGRTDDAIRIVDDELGEVRVPLEDVASARPEVGF